MIRHSNHHLNSSDTRVHDDEPDAWIFFKRALRLRCPECGQTPIFVRVRKMKRLSDWFQPLDGCPRCGYAYEREPGYFLLSIWAINYGVVGSIGLIGTFGADYFLHPALWAMICFVWLPLPILNLLFVRHSKALFLAMDHYFDPHLKRK